MKLSDVFKPLDDKKFSMFHIKSLITTGMGVFTDGYDLSSIGIVIAIVLGSFGLHPHTAAYNFWEGWVSSSALIGAAIGALIFGALSNRGRKTFYGVDVALLGVGAILQAFVTTPLELVIVRAILGLGVGADYTLSPMIMAEHSNAKDRGKIIALGFGLMWGFGATVAAGIYLILTALGLPSFEVWKIVLAAGAIPALSVLYLRRKIPETPRYLLRIKGDIQKFETVVKEVAGKSVGIQSNLKDTNSFSTYFKKQWKIFLAACSLWFLFDLSAYTGILFGPTTIAHSVGINNSGIFQFIIEFAFTVPGGLLALAAIDRIGRKPMQVLGFIGMAAALLAFSFLVRIVPAILALFIYGMYNFFSQAGPGSISASGMLGVELAPTKVRGTVQSLTVASGRTGATLSGLIVPTIILPSIGVTGLTLFLSILTFIAAAITFFFIPETKDKPLEESSMENQYATNTIS
ncbi:MFS transporter [Acidianus sulfidivorans JP7]|uniref:MFS transporter n=1 Tax=Acidianus sulfidivorans JP7 TaxID=619593 RepID=A0A2U9ILQ2_9CREN|nr:MFS transporter [Acidianus sulfidivorans]AWR96989.1 MFS transporter [Acidianus sulfidivorans JP7]